ncbi:MAG: ABC transporter ATP-binding protein [Lysobacteraceae bacterium]|jgi:ABC-2 type transport system ATP-binding protein|nr:ABC transporter ATP-binding protein [Xanthomonadaceae bacterium]MCZ8317873.1 ABC transporter ATP-binding protein [Silanimonas sp.]
MATVDHAPPPPAVDVRDLVAGYGDTRVLDGVSLHVASGELLAVLGGNGAGKSTLLKVLLGLLPVEDGQVHVFGLDPRASSAEVRRRLAFVPEQAAVYPHLDAIENLDYLLGLAGHARDRGRIADALHAVGLAEAAWRRAAGTYSKGMRQKLLLALADLRGSDLVLLDEPSSGLDPGATAELADRLRRWRAAGKAVLMVSHDLAAVGELADRWLWLERGRVLREGRGELPGPSAWRATPGAAA